MRDAMRDSEMSLRVVAERVAAYPGSFDRAGARATGSAQENGLVVEPAAGASLDRNHRIPRADDLNVQLRLAVLHLVHHIRLPQGCCFHRIPRRCHRTEWDQSIHTRYHSCFGRSLPMMPANHGVFRFSMETLVGCDKGLAWGC